MIKPTRFTYSTLLVLLVQFALAGALLAEDRPELQTVSAVDLDRYAGRWYEVARLPNWFQDQCVGNVTATYRLLDDGTVEVVNRCLDKAGVMDEANGVARIVDQSTNAKLEVSFVSVLGWRLFWGDYWVLGLGDNYEYAVVGMPSRDYAWILARSPELSPDAWRDARQVLVRAGYDPDMLVRTRQEN